MAVGLDADESRRAAHGDKASASAEDGEAESRRRRALSAWREHDGARSLHAPDREAIQATEAARALVLELLESAKASRDLYNACARLGRLLADGGASPSLAVSTVDGAVRALADVDVTIDAARVPAACASVAEGYFAVVVETERALARRAWEYPACAVRVSKDSVAVACGIPDGEGDALADWAARVALSASRDGYKRAVLSGDATARAEVTQALSLVGIAVVESVEAPRERGWLASFLKK